MANKQHKIKTSTKEGKRIFMRTYMSSYRKEERELLNLAKQTWGWSRKGLSAKKEKIQ
jgi:hypothetical protein